MPTTLIVGGSVAGTRVALDLRQLGYAGDIVLVDEQAVAPYDRPPLSKDLLTSANELPQPLLPADRAREKAIELRLGAAAVELDLARPEICLEDGTRLGFDALVIATGARTRPMPWPSHERIVELRTLADGRRLRRALRTSRTVAVVGAGFIGAEVASAARTLGLDVVVIDPAPVPMGRLFGDEMGQRFTRLHAMNGVTTRFGRGITGIEDRADCAVVHLDDTSTLNVDLVVVGIGVVPNDEWLSSSGLAVENGVVCDSRCRARGHTNIYAAGDVARWFHRRHNETVRVEHWTNAVEQAQFVAKAIAQPWSVAEFAPVEYVWSNQYEWKIQVAGRPDRGASECVIEDSGHKRFCAAYTRPSGTLVGVLAVNWPKVALLARRAVADAEPMADFLARVGALRK
ncbi:NAD(P)/FAD-dependent oxidoreductase [Sciscionella marina]|uniref:NAD(P)/FAD-dependent oxidoreductase n=1 Tax=Sciscionella marina TaxID=508770 RepID=UPI000366203D|nr:FAD-dependent oxidoreductase [Sciscionella marina]